MPFHSQNVEVLFEEAVLHQRIRDLGAQITRDYHGKELTLIVILKGSVFFAVDLAQAIDLPLQVEFLAVSSYQGGTETTGEVRVTLDLTTPMAGRHLLVVEDIVDTGLTVQFLLDNLKARHPASVKVCTLLEKPSRARAQVSVDYKGFVIGDQFVVGYGLDYQERYRNLPFVGVLKG